jgi:phosphotransferase system enzyme I (PtsP)
MKKKGRRHLHLLCDISELAALLIGSENIESFFQQAVEMVARHMEADVCSIYLLDENSEELVLKATIGLNPEAVGEIRMKIGEGLVGTTLQKLKPMREGSAGRHPKFKYFKEAQEDPFDSFLSVPVQRGEEKIGVLVVQHQKRDYFDEVDVMAMRAISSQLAGAIGNARQLMEQNQQRAQKTSNYRISPRLRMIKGQVASPGYAFAPATMFDKSHGALVSVEIDTETKYSLSDIPFLLGIGVRILSVYPKFLPSVQKAISGLTIDDAQLYAGRLLSETTLKGIREALKYLTKTDIFNK